ncbi:hypothetical protein BGP84_00475 [Pseudomonas putida]|uniref:DUF2806 domain-containing protein n=1 Tax=Pseudomonas putida TaxID=303 RepID=A0A2S3X8J3_PSEPU|nr:MULTISPECIES: DUF2806 domain-containing protein [Pseudomonas]POG01124.1 hypothetical protein BGP85_21735 [Pseudomonas putida]POG11787.1 hypothetical protein BGP84_00475 [Pseudomonas putida]
MKAPGEEILGKLWDTLADKGMGSLLRPSQIRREERARTEGKVHNLLSLAQAEKYAEEIKAGLATYQQDGKLKYLGSLDTDETERDSNGRIEPSLSFDFTPIKLKADADILRKEINETKAIIFAEEILTNTSTDEPVNSKPIDDEWLFLWRENAGKTSNEDIQRLWGSVLAGEIKSPGSYSFRTLEFLKGITREEANIIQSVAPYVWENGFIWRNLNVLEQHGVSYESLLDLQALGILMGVDSENVSMYFESVFSDKYLFTIKCHNRMLAFQHADPKQRLTMPAIRLTSIGKQVIKLEHTVAKDDFMAEYALLYKEQNFTALLGDFEVVYENDMPTHFKGINMVSIY